MYLKNQLYEYNTDVLFKLKRLKRQCILINLKKKYLIRKYGYLYLSKCFATLRPTEAWIYYEKRLLTKTFSKWKLINQRKNKLNQLKQNQNQLILKKCFSILYQNKNDKILKRKQLEIIKIFYELKLKNTFFKKFKLYYQSCKNEKLYLKIKLYLIKISFEKRHKILRELAYVNNRMYILQTLLSLNHYNCRILKECWLKWRMFIFNNKKLSLQINKARNFNRKLILKKYYHLWKIYHIVRLTKLHLKEYSILWHKKNIFSEFFVKWRIR